MIPSGARAYAQARVRAWKSRLLSREDAAPLLAATDAASVRRALSLLRVADRDAMSRTVRRAYRREDTLLAALEGLRGIEEVKLAWRRERRRSDLVDRFAKTPYAAITAAVAAAHGSDIAAAELAFDRWASERLLAAARTLPKEERLTRRLLENVIRERDQQIIRRGEKWYGLSPSAAAARALLSRHLESVEELRRERLLLCRRAFIGSPFALAPAVALLLLADEEARAVTALTEREGDSELDEPLLRAMAGSLVGVA